MIALDHYGHVRAASAKKYRAFFGCLAFFLLGSIAILTVGIVLFFLPNERAAKVNLYNGAIGLFNTSLMSLWAEGGTMGLHGWQGENIAMLNVSLSPFILGSLEGIDRSGFSYLASAVVSLVNSSSSTSATSPTVAPAPVSAASTIDLEFRPHTSAAVIRRGVPRSKTYSYNVMCNVTTAEAQCRAVYPNAKFKAVISSGVCSCSSTMYLTKYCAVVERSPAEASDGSAETDADLWVASTVFGSCFYPFSPSDQLYASPAEQDRIELHLYSRDDPFLVLEQQTLGTHNFGLTISAQRSAALLLILVGIVLGTLLTLGGVLLLNGIHSMKEKEPASPIVFPTPHIVRTVAWPDTELTMQRGRQIPVNNLSFPSRSAEAALRNSGELPHVAVDLQE